MEMNKIFKNINYQTVSSFSAIITIFVFIYLAGIYERKVEPVSSEVFNQNIEIEVKEEKNYNATIEYQYVKINNDQSKSYVYSTYNDNYIFESKQKFTENKFVVNAIKKDIKISNKSIRKIDNHGFIENWDGLQDYYYFFEIPVLRETGNLISNKDDYFVGTADDEQIKDLFYKSYIKAFHSKKTSDSITKLSTESVLMYLLVTFGGTYSILISIQVVQKFINQRRSKNG